MIKVQENVLLEDLTTFRIGGRARYFSFARNEEDLRELFAFAKSRKLLIFVLGGGSNLLVSDNGFPGLVIKNEIKGIKFIDKAGDKVILEIGAGEILDEVITLSVMRNLFGLENLSGIPGTVGGAAVQNAGAYGVELKDYLILVEGLNSANGKKFVLKKADCEYSYRDSYFKKKKKFVITSVTLELNKKGTFNLDYAGLKNELAKEGKITSQKIREAVMEIRKGKLPDWHKVGTAGSFFRNPIISKIKYEKLKEKFPELPVFPESLGLVKVSLAWILDKICGLKGFKLGQVGLYEKQPLIMINLGGATALDVANLSVYVKNQVKEKTGIAVEEEVERV